MEASTFKARLQESADKALSREKAGPACASEKFTKSFPSVK